MAASLLQVYCVSYWLGGPNIDLVNSYFNYYKWTTESMTPIALHLRHQRLISGKKEQNIKSLVGGSPH